MPFRHLDYRRAVADLVEARKAVDRSVTYTRVAVAAGMQPTYLSNVMHGRAHLSADQLYQVGKFLGRSEEEIRYLLLLLEWERSLVPGRKAQLRKEIEAMRSEDRRTKRHLRAGAADPSDLTSATYYLDPLVTIVHVALRIPRFAKAPLAIGRELGVTAEHLDRALRTLEALGYIRRTAGGGYDVLVAHRHLPESSPVCVPHQAQMRMKTIEHMHRTAPGKRYHVSVTVTGDDETRDQLQRRFLDFLSEAEAIVKRAPDAGVYQMNFDLFPWSQRID